MNKARQVVMIMTDTQRADMVGCYGNPAMKTPCLDALAGQGVRFTRAYTCVPVCGPARSCLFTGSWSHINNGWANSMAPDIKTKHLGDRIHELGLPAAYIGKWHLDGGDYFGEGRCPKGWEPDYWYEMKNYLDELTPEGRLASRQETTNFQTGGVADEFTFAHRVTQRALEFIRKNESADFLLVVSYDEPHHPYLAPQRFLDLHQDTRLPWQPNMADSLAGKPEHHRVWAGAAIEQQDRESLELRYQSFFACNSFVDHEIGRVVEAIDRHAPDALVLYTSDHGDMLESHRLTNKGPAMYEEITRVPFIVRWPGVIPPGSVSANLVTHIDVLPTVLSASGEGTLSPQLHGRSMLPMLHDLSRPTNAEIFVEFGRYEIDHDGFGGFQPIRCIRDPRYKLVINLLCHDELYDLQSDPGEMTNLIESSAHATLRDRLHDKLIDWMNRTRDPFRGYYWLRRPWRKDAPAPTWAFTGYTRQREPELNEASQLDYDTGLPMEQATRRKIFSTRKDVAGEATAEA